MTTSPPISTPSLWFFRRIVRRYLRRHFHAVRLSGSHNLPDAAGPLIVYANHGSWWDPMISIHLAEKLMPTLRHYAPMDQAALARYAILSKVGVFPVEKNTLRGAAQFHRTGSLILQSGGVLWITPQGRFVDVRARPLDFKPGLSALAAHVAAKLGSCTLLPLAIEYPFWDERLPEVLLNFGPPVHVLKGEPTDEIEHRLTNALEAAMNDLRDLALRRDPSAFLSLTSGSSGVGGFYAIGQRLKAFLTRRPYQPDHTSNVQPDPTPQDPQDSESQIEAQTDAQLESQLPARAQQLTEPKNRQSQSIGRAQ